MTAIGTLSPGSSGIAASPEVTGPDAAIDRDDALSNAATPTLVEGVKVSLSGAAIAKSAGVGGKNSDIDESGLPENVQQLLKMIRKLRQQIAEKNAQINALMANKTLSNEERFARIAALKGAISALNNGLITANLSLAKVIDQSGLTADQNLKTNTLLMKS